MHQKKKLHEISVPKRAGYVLKASLDNYKSMGKFVKRGVTGDFKGAGKAAAKITKRTDKMLDASNPRRYKNVAEGSLKTAAGVAGLAGAVGLAGYAVHKKNKENEALRSFQHDATSSPRFLLMTHKHPKTGAVLGTSVIVRDEKDRGPLAKKYGEHRVLRYNDVFPNRQKANEETGMKTYKSFIAEQEQHLSELFNKETRYGAKKGLKLGAWGGAAAGAIGGAAVGGPVGAVAGGALGAVKGAALGTAAGAGVGSVVHDWKRADRKGYKNEETQLDEFNLRGYGKAAGEAIKRGASKTKEAYNKLSPKQKAGAGGAVAGGFAGAAGGAAFSKHHKKHVREDRNQPDQYLPNDPSDKKGSGFVSLKHEKTNKSREHRRSLRKDQKSQS